MPKLKLRSISFVFLLITIFLLLETSAWAQGCAICRAALANSPEGRVLAGAFRRGILVLMVVPYGIFSAMGFGIYRAYRRSKKGVGGPSDGGPDANEAARDII
jgi:hypothetical protein